MGVHGGGFKSFLAATGMDSLYASGIQVIFGAWDLLIFAHP